MKELIALIVGASIAEEFMKSGHHSRSECYMFGSPLSCRSEESIWMVGVGTEPMFLLTIVLFESSSYVTVSVYSKVLASVSTEWTSNNKN